MTDTIRRVLWEYAAIHDATTTTAPRVGRAIQRRPGAATIIEVE